MYSLTLELNQKCNLNCKYCYLSNKDNKQMDIEDAYKSIKFGINKAKLHKDNTLFISFIGGEAILSFNMITDLVNFANKECSNNNIFVKYSLTTNAVDINKSIIDFLIYNNFLLKVSIDGDKKTHDINRITKNGVGSFDKITHNIPFLKYYEEKTNNSIQITHVVTKNNFKEFYNSLVFLTDTLNFKYIDTAIDPYCNWTLDDFEILKKSIAKSFYYFCDSYNQNRFHWSFIDGLNSTLKKKNKVYSCGGGIISSYIKNNGNIYSCPTCFKEEAKLGNINSGLIVEKINKLKNLKEIKYDKCINCKIYDYCSAKGCIMINLEINHNINIPNTINCLMEKFKYEFIRKNGDYLNEVIGL